MSMNTAAIWKALRANFSEQQSEALLDAIEGGNAIREDVQQLKVEVQQLKKDVGHLLESVETIKTNVKELKAGVDVVKHDSGVQKAMLALLITVQVGLLWKVMGK